MKQIAGLIVKQEKSKAHATTNLGRKMLHYGSGPGAA